MAAGKKPVLRRCVGCGEMKEKKDLIRVVRGMDGVISIDLTQKVNGRGAYVCRSRSCLELAVKRRGLERTLRCSIERHAAEQILEQIEAVL